MSPRPGAIGRHTELPAEYANLRDPAHGAAAPRCTICGVPGVERDGDWVTAAEGHRFYRGSWSALRFIMPDDRCEPCVRRQMERVADLAA